MALAPPAGYEPTASGLLLPITMRAAAFGDETNSQYAAEWLRDWASGGGRSHAGVHVSPQSSMALSTYYDCLRIIAEDCAKLPLQVLERLERGRSKAVDHPLWSILHDEFNADMTSMTAREVMTHHAVGWGNGYGLIIRDRS